MTEVCLPVRGNVQDVRLITLYENLVKDCQALVTQGIVKIVPTQPFIIMMAN